MEASSWDDKIDYLRNTRWTLYNDDYIEFLVKNVWKITEPIRLIDFGCGYGFMGLKLLPMLPLGSTYTGVDAGGALLAHAKELFAQLPYESEFIRADIQTVSLERKYDMAISHAFLMHMPNPKEILHKMIDCVEDQGRIACFEAHWIANMASYYFEGVDQSDLVQLGPTQRLYESDTKREGKDGNIGIKLPVYMSELGVKQVQCRVSDRVNFLDLNTGLENRNKLANSMRPSPCGEKEEFVHNLMMRGMTAQEASQQYECERRFEAALHPDAYFAEASSMKISFGLIDRT
ncbi:class I SAM-dependent methyltransferase [Paenibacillus sp. H1-7]|uniref:class I SAM-dependent methyltransferase n=1 Tax=Paenibacillus sp. H1-7 TaxID=2282849 RepID=UPI001EF9A4EA|nr:class I SAM-dependent methyltransferase [Paenibacillus sp. H1-7]ULL19861.1 class I SAM-dependent methyltransferase [Paenibacillus sp. H1-7]